MIKIISLAVLASIFLPAFLTLVGLPFKKSLGVRRFRNGKHTLHYDLPDWLRWMQNPKDGLTGDERGWYWFEYFPSWVPAWFKMFWWSGVRNPFNYLKRYVIGIDIRQYEFVKLCGDDYVRDRIENQGFQILLAKPIKGGIPRGMLYWVKELYNGRGICLQIGWKIALKYNDIKYSDERDNWKGVTFEPNPFKRLG